MACWIEGDRLRVTLPSQFRRHRHDGCWLCWLMRILRELAGCVRPYWQAHLCFMGLGHTYNPISARCYGCKRDWHELEWSWRGCKSYLTVDFPPMWPSPRHGDVVTVRTPGRYFHA